jgi:hypothetical protein
MYGYSIQEFLLDLVDFFNSVVIPAIIVIAIVFIIWNAFRYFILQGATEEGRDLAKRLLLYGVLALVVTVSLWGIVRLMIGTFGIVNTNAPCPDFNPDCFDTVDAARIGNGNNGPFFNISN